MISEALIIRPPEDKKRENLKQLLEVSPAWLKQSCSWKEEEEMQSVVLFLRQI